MAVKNYRGIQAASPYNGEEFIELFKMYGNAKVGFPAIEIGYFPLNFFEEDADVAVCYDCKHRKTSCYVDKRGLIAMFKSFITGTNYVEQVKMRHFKNRFVRFGLWGDPVVVGYERCDEIRNAATGHAGYTHQWRTCDQRFSKLIQASADTEKEALEAQQMGWKTFRVKLPAMAVMVGEVVCPNQKDKEINCITCGICDGVTANVVIDVHGLEHKQIKFEKIQADLMGVENVHDIG